MSWVLLYYTVTGTIIQAGEFKRESECFTALMRYYDTNHKTNFRCEARYGKEKE